MSIDYTSVEAVANHYEFLFLRFIHDHCSGYGTTKLQRFEDLFNCYCYEARIEPIERVVLNEIIKRAGLGVDCIYAGPRALVAGSVEYDADPEIMKEYNRYWNPDYEEEETAEQRAEAERKEMDREMNRWMED